MRPPDRLGGRAARGPLPSGTPSTRIRGAGRRTRGPRIRPGGMVVSGHGGVREAARRRRYVRWGARGARRCRRRRGWSRGGSGAGSGGRLLTSSPCRSGARPGTRQRRRRRARRGPRPAAGPTGTSRGLASSPPISADRGRGRGKRARQRGAQVNELGGHAATGRIRRSFPRSRGGRCGTTPGSTGRTAKWCRCSSCRRRHRFRRCRRPVLCCSPWCSRNHDVAGPGADSRAAPAGCGTSLREVRLEPETRNSRGRTARPAPIGAQAPSTVDGGGAFGGPDSFTSL